MVVAGKLCGLSQKGPITYTEHDTGRRKTEFRSQFRDLRKNEGSERINKWVDIKES